MLNFLCIHEAQPVALNSDVICVEELDFPPSSPDKFSHISQSLLKFPIAHFFQLPHISIILTKISSIPTVFKRLQQTSHLSQLQNSTVILN